MKKGTRIWVCDGCGKCETWRSGWGYLYGIESPANSPTSDGLLLPLAGCSEACLDKALDTLVGCTLTTKYAAETVPRHSEEER